MATIAVFGEGSVGKDRVIAAIQLGNYKIKNKISTKIADMNAMLSSISDLNTIYVLFRSLLINFQKIINFHEQSYNNYSNSIQDATEKLEFKETFKGCYAGTTQPPPLPISARCITFLKDFFKYTMTDSSIADMKRIYDNNEDEQNRRSVYLYNIKHFYEKFIKDKYESLDDEVIEYKGVNEIDEEDFLSLNKPTDGYFHIKDEMFPIPSPGKGWGTYPTTPIRIRHASGYSQHLKNAINEISRDERIYIFKSPVYILVLSALSNKTIENVISDFKMKVQDYFSDPDFFNPIQVIVFISKTEEVDIKKVDEIKNSVSKYFEDDKVKGENKVFKKLQNYYVVSEADNMGPGTYNIVEYSKKMTKYQCKEGLYENVAHYILNCLERGLENTRFKKRITGHLSSSLGGKRRATRRKKSRRSKKTRQRRVR